jgi:hypothetical protein
MALALPNAPVKRSIAVSGHGFSHAAKQPTEGGFSR